MSDSGRVGVVVVTFESPADLLARCLDSIASSIGGDSLEGNLGDLGDLGRLGSLGRPGRLGHFGGPVVDVVIVDNASAVAPNVGGSARLIRRPTNDGFAAAVNRGIEELSPACSLVFLLNPDAAVHPDAIARCVERLEASPDDVVAVAPKMLLTEAKGPLADSGPSGDPATIDAVGIGINDRAEAANRGLGQPDLGQYDTSEDVFGACFGAAMIRRSAFDPSKVGPLDRRLFLYYEDVAWCWSAQLLGYRIVTEPRAIVHHVMSAGVVRERPYAFKFEHTERNLLVCALMFFAPAQAARVTVRRALGILRGSLLGRHYPMAGLRALRGTLLLLPHVIRTRQRVTKRRSRNDAEIVAYLHDEPIFFDSVRYTVPDPAAAERFARARLQTNTPT